MRRITPRLSAVVAYTHDPLDPDDVEWFNARHDDNTLRLATMSERLNTTLATNTGVLFGLAAAFVVPDAGGQSTLARVMLTASLVSLALSTLTSLSAVYVCNNANEVLRERREYRADRKREPQPLKRWHDHGRWISFLSLAAYGLFIAALAGVLFYAVAVIF